MSNMSTINLLEIKDKKKNLENRREKEQITYCGTIPNAAYLSKEITKAERKMNNFFKAKKSRKPVNQNSINNKNILQENKMK